MDSFRPTQIFASLPKSSPASKTEKKRSGENSIMKISEGMLSPNSANKSKRSNNHEITVIATGEMSQLPDRCKIAITIHSKKGAVEEAKNSVSRRLDYVTQALHNHQVKDNDIKIVKTLQREEGMFHYSAEVLATFSEPEKCQDLCNLLVEKLDENVKVSIPQFFHSPQKIENLRRQACLLAVSNAKQKASEIAAFLHTSLGKAMNVLEESSSEWEGSDDIMANQDHHPSFQHKFSQAKFNVTAKISATFELKSSKNSAGNT